MNWWHRLSYRLTIFILVLALVPLAGFGLFTIKDIQNARLLSIELIHGNMAINVAERIESSLANAVEKIGLVMESNELETLDVSDQEWILQMLIKSLPPLHALEIIDMDGRVKVKVGYDNVYNTKNLKQHVDLPDFLNMQDKKPIIGSQYITDQTVLVFDLFIPILNPIDRQVIAVVAAEINIEKLLGFVADLRLGRTGYVYIVNDQGKILAHPDRSLVLAKERELNNPLVNDFVSGRKVVETNKTYVNRTQIEVLTNAHAVKEMNLLVVVAQSVEEAMSVVTQITRRQVKNLALVFMTAILMAVYFILKLNRPMSRLASGAQLLGSGNLSHRIEVISSDEIGSVTRSFNAMAEDLEASKRTADQLNWVRQGVLELDEQLRGDLSLEKACSNIIHFMAGYLKGQVGLVYVHDGNGSYHYIAGYAFMPGKGFSNCFGLGQGLPGQAALEKRMLTVSELPPDYISITSGMGNRVPKHLIIVPFVFNNQVEAVMELGSLTPLTEQQNLFIADTADNIAVVIAAARSRQNLNTALVQTRQQAEELQKQQEELQAANEEMEEQTQLLMASENKLKEQQEELQAANEELEEKTQYLERNKKHIEEKNKALEFLRANLEKKAEDLTIASKYKSEFLANMSHELRTPLNSLLLLARLLADNKEKNLLADQVESARIIYNSGNDLLALINEILDLSKIEAGKMKLSLDEIPLKDLSEALDKNFKRLTQEKGLSLDISIKADVPKIIISDQQRIMQILKNFIANACKFTSTGGVTVEFYRPDKSIAFLRNDLIYPDTIAIAVKDTGIGIPEDKQKIIFEAFQQVEGGSARKYGGTGLGLSISRELATLLGGEIQLKSILNEGATFTLFLPIKATTQASVSIPTSPSYKKSEAPARMMVKKNDNQEQLTSVIEDDREQLGPEDKIVLIIEDDVEFAATLIKSCRQKGFKALVSLNGEDGLQLAQSFNINAIILDIHLPGMDGWAVLESLKENPSTRHIPVHFMSADDPVPEAFTKGAVGYLTKPVTLEGLEETIINLKAMVNKQPKDLLLVEDNANQRHAINNLIGNNDVVTQEVSTGKEALAVLQSKQFDCMILDLGLPDMSGFDLLKKIEKDPLIKLPPVIVYTGRELTSDEENELRKYSDSIIIKGVRSEERLLDETALFLHRVIDKMPEDKRKIISILHDSDQALRNSTILIVDDDMRNVFALSKVLNDKGANTIKAENGVKALDILSHRNDVDMVLMDIMMPVMDGYETMKKIRMESRFNSLPIIALTAKAMQRDKDACIAAGANDYLAKPLEIDRLLSMMRVWLYR
ncbi:response regulator [Desulfobacter hydrogenophilus]|nr:response regulator [Desulfobacter hydrogenophilus]NDY73798.1 response regulator [Desulfobacter hydrogenophilus]